MIARERLNLSTAELRLKANAAYPKNVPSSGTATKQKPYAINMCTPRTVVCVALLVAIGVLTYG